MGRVDRVEQQVPALLEVLVVRRGRVLDHGQDARQVALHAPRLAPHELQCVGVLLLRHQRRARRVRVAALDHRKGAGRVDDEVLRPAREVRQSQGAPAGEEASSARPRNVILRNERRCVRATSSSCSWRPRPGAPRAE